MSAEKTSERRKRSGSARTVDFCGLSAERLLEIYRYLRLTRSLEERLVNLFRQTKVVGGLFRSLGQEGESVASAYALDRRLDGTGMCFLR